MTYLLDTCVLGELLRPRPAKSVVRWLDAADESLLHISVITLGEIQKGIARLPKSKKRSALEAWITAELQPRFAKRTLPVNEAVARRWGEISGAAEQRGRKLPVLDALIGATALELGLTVVTRNTADLGRTGAKTLDPWLG